MSWHLWFQEMKKLWRFWTPLCKTPEYLQKVLKNTNNDLDFNLNECVKGLEQTYLNFGMKDCEIMEKFCIPLNKKDDRIWKFN